MIRIKRVYEPPAASDGVRILVDRIWPRGLTKQDARIDVWLKEIAPSTELRRWFAHDPERWNEFRRRYHEELGAKAARVEEIARRADQETVTLVYGARDTEHNNARCLQEHLQRQAAGRQRR